MKRWKVKPNIPMADHLKIATALREMRMTLGTLSVNLRTHYPPWEGPTPNQATECAREAVHAVTALCHEMEKRMLWEHHNKCLGCTYPHEDGRFEFNNLFHFTGESPNVLALVQSPVFMRRQEELEDDEDDDDEDEELEQDDDESGDDRGTKDDLEDDDEEDDEDQD
jgi:hypothetical protein